MASGETGRSPRRGIRLPIFYFSNVSELRGPGEPSGRRAVASELDYELEIGALIDTPVEDLTAERGEEAIGGYFVLNDWSARDLQRDETTVRLGPAKGKDFATSHRAVAGDARRARTGARPARPGSTSR